MTLATTQIEHEAFEFASMPAGWTQLLGLGLLVGVCAWSFWLYRREARVGASPRLRTTLAAARSLVFVVLTLVLLQPVVVRYTEITTPAAVVVLVDESASMRIADPDEEGGLAGGATRSEQVEALLTPTDGSWLRQLATSNETAVFAFAGKTRRLATTPKTAPANDDDVDAGRTDLGQAWRRAMDEMEDRPVAGVIVVSDGALNTGMGADEIAAQARRLDVAVHAVGVGGEEEPPNIRIVELAAPSTAPRGDPFEVLVDVEARGVRTAEIEVSLSAAPMSENGAGAEIELGTRRISVDSQAGMAPLEFMVEPPEAGDYLFWARATVLDDEAFADDNTRAVPVRIVDKQLRVLLVAGRPSYEYRYVTRLLERDRTVDVSCWLQSADEQAVRDGDTIITSLPQEPEELFEYDVVILMDPNPEGLSDAWALAVRRFVDEFGGGVLYQAGTHYSTRLLPDARLGDLVNILPAAPDPEAAVRLGEQGAFQTRSFALAPPEEAVGHPLVTMAADPVMNATAWSSLPRMWWSYPVRRAKPAASVLLARAGADAAGEVVFAIQSFGAGRCAFLGTESTWRWRSTAETQFNSFWINVVRYLGYARRQSATARGGLILEREALSVGEYLKVEAQVLTPGFEPLTQAEIVAQVQLGDGQPEDFVLRAAAGRDGWFTGRMLMSAEGAGVIRLPIPDPQPGQPATLTRYFRVQRPDLEMRALALNAVALQQLAEQTGGVYVSLRDANKLATIIEPAEETRVERGPEHDLWDGPWTLIVLAALLGLEWTLRRRSYLL